MRIALISDVHANVRALTAVLSDAATRCVDAYVSLGDIVFMGLEPQQCFDALLALHPIACIKGNTDANVEEAATFRPSSDFEQKIAAVLSYCERGLHEASKEMMAMWPTVKRVDIAGRRIVFCHGSPYNAAEQLAPDIIVASRTVDRLMAEQAAVVCCGHTHAPADFYIGGQRVVNPGAVGYSFDGDRRASYGILDVNANRIGWENHRVEYDIEAYRQLLVAASSELGLLKHVAYALEHGRPMPNYSR